MYFRLIAPLLALVFLQCQDTARTHKWFAMDTNMSVSLFGPTRISDDSAFYRMEEETERLNQIFSDFSTRSALSEIKGHIGDTILVHPEIYQVLKIALETGKATQGTFDITLHDLKWLWGLGSGQTGQVPDSTSIDSLMQSNPTFHSNWDSAADRHPVTLLPGSRAILKRENVTLDLGAIAKGYIVDKLHALLDSLGCPNHLLQAGGEIRLGGKKKAGPWSIGIQHPRAADSGAGLIRSATPLAISTSGDYERFFEEDGVRYHHIFDPQTGRPAGPYSGVTVVAESSIWADAMSTSLFILGPERGMALARQFHAAAVG
jgi:thiamine biosynthesis lipoprotein